jgi:hypothetical protein
MSTGILELLTLPYDEVAYQAVEKGDSLPPETRQEIIELVDALLRQHAREEKNKKGGKN